MPRSVRQPIAAAPRPRRARLGRLLQERREDNLGYRTRVGFEEATDVNRRMSADIERAARDTFDINTLRDVALAYRVTYESIVKVAWGDAEELTPADLQPELEPAAPPSAPPSALLREDADRPYFSSIWDRLLDLADRGNPDPTGAQLGLGPDDAKLWDGTRGAMSRGDRAWLLADIQRRRREARDQSNGRPGANTA